LLGLLLIEVRWLVFIHNLLYNLFFLVKPISAYLWKVINCEFNWWNSCLYFDVMFGYVNLLIIKLLMMKLHAQYMFIYILCWFCSNWYKLVLLLLIVMNSCLNEVVVELDMLLLLICTMGIPFCEVVVWIGEVCVKLFMWRTKMNFWCMRLLTEFSTWLNELDLVDFLFSCCGCVSRVVWEKTGFHVRSWCLSVFANERMREVLENNFWDGWNLNFSVDYERAKS